MPYTRRISVTDAVDTGYPGYQAVFDVNAAPNIAAGHAVKARRGDGARRAVEAREP
jgi:hypothetical protein